MWASHKSAPLGLVHLMLTKARLDSKKRSLLAMVNQHGLTALHIAIRSNVWLSKPAEIELAAVLDLLIHSRPPMLLATTNEGKTLLQLARYHPALIRSLLETATNKYKVQLVVDEVCLKFEVPRDIMNLRDLRVPLLSLF